MLEIAIVSTKCALRDEFPEFMEFFEAKAWEPEVTEEVTEAEATETDAIESETTETPDTQE